MESEDSGTPRVVAVKAAPTGEDASRRMQEWLLAQQRRKEEYWMRKYGRAAPQVPSHNGARLSNERSHSTLPPIGGPHGGSPGGLRPQHQQHHSAGPGGRRGAPPLFQAAGPINSFPMKGAFRKDPDRRHNAAAIPYHPAPPTILPPLDHPTHQQGHHHHQQQGQGQGQVDREGSVASLGMSPPPPSMSPLPHPPLTGQHSMGVLPPISHRGAAPGGGAPGGLGSPMSGGNMSPLGAGGAFLREEASAPPATFGYSTNYNGGGVFGGEPLSPLSRPSAVPPGMAGMPPGSKLAHPPHANVVMQHPPPQYAGIGPRVVTHHAKGMRDLQLELAVLKVIKAREDVLERLKVAAEKLDSAMGGTAPLALPPADPLVRLFFRLVGQLRQRTLDVVEAIAAWHRRTMSGSPFMYYGRNYLAGIGPDLAFLDTQPFLRLRLHEQKAVEDPFLPDVTPDGIPIEEATSTDLRRGGHRFSSDALRIRMARKVLATYGGHPGRRWLSSAGLTHHAGDVATSMDLPPGGLMDSTMRSSTSSFILAPPPAGAGATGILKGSSIVSRSSATVSPAFNPGGEGDAAGAGDGAEGTAGSLDGRHAAGGDDDEPTEDELLEYTQVVAAHNELLAPFLDTSPPSKTASPAPPAEEPPTDLVAAEAEGAAEAPAASAAAAGAEGETEAEGAADAEAISEGGVAAQEVTHHQEEQKEQQPQEEAGAAAEAAAEATAVAEAEEADSVSAGAEMALAGVVHESAAPQEATQHQEEEEQQQQQEEAQDEDAAGAAAVAPQGEQAGASQEASPDQPAEPQAMAGAVPDVEGPFVLDQPALLQQQSRAQEGESAATTPMQLADESLVPQDEEQPPPPAQLPPAAAEAVAAGSSDTQLLAKAPSAAQRESLPGVVARSTSVMSGTAASTDAAMQDQLLTPEGADLAGPQLDQQAALLQAGQGDSQEQQPGQEEEEEGAEDDDGAFLDFALYAMVESLAEPYASQIAPGEFTVAGWEIDRQLDTLLGGLDPSGAAGAFDDAANHGDYDTAGYAADAAAALSDTTGDDQTGAHDNAGAGTGDVITRGAASFSTRFGGLSGSGTTGSFKPARSNFQGRGSKSMAGAALGRDGDVWVQDGGGIPSEQALRSYKSMGGAPSDDSPPLQAPLVVTYPRAASSIRRNTSLYQGVHVELHASGDSLHVILVPTSLHNQQQQQHPHAPTAPGLGGSVDSSSGVLLGSASDWEASAAAVPAVVPADGTADDGTADGSAAALRRPPTRQIRLGLHVSNGQVHAQLLPVTQSSESNPADGGSAGPPEGTTQVAVALDLYEGDIQGRPGSMQGSTIGASSMLHRSTSSSSTVPHGGTYQRQPSAAVQLLLDISGDIVHANLKPHTMATSTSMPGSNASSTPAGQVLQRPGSMGSYASMGGRSQIQLLLALEGPHGGALAEAGTAGEAGSQQGSTTVGGRSSSTGGTLGLSGRLGGSMRLRTSGSFGGSARLLALNLDFSGEGVQAQLVPRQGAHGTAGTATVLPVLQEEEGEGLSPGPSARGTTGFAGSDAVLAVQPPAVHAVQQSASMRKSDQGLLRSASFQQGARVQLRLAFDEAGEVAVELIPASDQITKPMTPQQLPRSFSSMSRPGTAQVVTLALQVSGDEVQAQILPAAGAGAALARNGSRLSSRGAGNEKAGLLSASHDIDELVDDLVMSIDQGV